MDHGCKEKNLKFEIKKMDFKNIILICETKINLEEDKVFICFQKLKKLLMNSLSAKNV